MAVELRTARLRLIPAVERHLTAELESSAALSTTLGVDVPSSWPPELYDEDAIRWTLSAIADGRMTPGWGLYYVAELTSESPRDLLVGAVGYKGPPDADRTVEIGYGIIPECRRRGYAREAVAALMAKAFADKRVDRVIAHTLRELTPSIGVLETSGFRFVGVGSDRTEPDAIQFGITRAEYETRTT